jgi:hypothetical protein
LRRFATLPTTGTRSKRCPQYEANFGFVCFAQKLTLQALRLPGDLKKKRMSWPTHGIDPSAVCQNSNARAALNIGEAGAWGWRRGRLL